PNNDIYTASLSSGGFQAMDIDDNLNGQLDPADMDINTIHFSSRTKGFVAGKYNGAGTTPKGYNRTIEDGAGLISQRFWYDQKGRQALAQNAKQYNNNHYSYTKYDPLSRKTEVGQKTNNSTGTKFKDIFGDYVQGYYNPAVISENNFLAFIDNSTGQRTEVLQQFFDKQNNSIANDYPSSFVPTELRKRMVSKTYEDIFDGDSTTYDHATHFSYGVHANPVKVLQENQKTGITSQRFKLIEYDDDVLTSLTKKVSYQKGQADAFYHKYTYDGDDRISEVFSSDNDIDYDRDVKYVYHKHGELARMEYGNNNIQGYDYIKTLRGWSKGVNATSLLPSRDPGLDGFASNNNPNQLFAVDAVSYSLYHYKNDFNSIDRWNNQNNRFEAILPNSNIKSQTNDLYNGNIALSVTTIRDSATLTPLPNGFAYKYDELDRIVYANAWQNLDITTNAWGNSTTDISRYKNIFEFDGNGNITYQERRNEQGNPIDHLHYFYNENSSKLIQNRLYYVTDQVPNPDFASDVDDQTTYNDPQAPIDEGSNYLYTELGELKRDSSEEITEIIWRSDQKISEIRRTQGSSKPNIKFDYNADGTRVAKHTYTSSGTWLKSTYYVTDDAGHCLAVYEKKADKSPIQIGGTQSKSLIFKLTERHIYGSSRIGKYAKEVTLSGGIKEELPHEEPDQVGIGGNKITPSNSPIKISSKLGKNKPLNHCIGERHYELGNHLKNVLTVVSDKKIGVDDGNGNISHYEPDILMASDYSPYGVKLSKRNYQTKSYRFGFNGKEQDHEWEQGDLNIYNYGLRIYNPSLARFLSVDPLTDQYAMLSPYQYASNSPIWGIDIDGLEFFGEAEFNLIRENWDPILGNKLIIRPMNIMYSTGSDPRPVPEFVWVHEERPVYKIVTNGNGYGLSGYSNIPMGEVLDPQATAIEESKLVIDHSAYQNAMVDWFNRNAERKKMQMQYDWIGAFVPIPGLNRFQSWTVQTVQKAVLAAKISRYGIKATSAVNRLMRKAFEMRGIQRGTSMDDLVRANNGQFRQVWTEGGYKYELRIKPATHGRVGHEVRVNRKLDLTGAPPGTQGSGVEHLDDAGNWIHNSILRGGDEAADAAARATHMQLPQKAVVDY
ncbi:MAG: RHS repeat-associated core domain-containing protein, partial [Flavobacteriales bacterium]|nr:RHS repeat-associated core domain-containing protein [Flavobacteriales bacterium]